MACMRATCAPRAAARPAAAGARAPRRCAARMSRTTVEYERVDYKAVHASLPKMGADKWNTTYYPTGADAREKEWVVIDAENLVLGRLASEAAMLLRGKKVRHAPPPARSPPSSAAPAAEDRPPFP